MKEIIINQSIEANIVMESKDVEALVNHTIRDALIRKMETTLDEMAFADMEFDSINNVFNIEASIVLCTTQDIATNAEMQAQKLAQYGLGEEEILEVLSLGLNENEGF